MSPQIVELIISKYWDFDRKSMGDRLFRPFIQSESVTPNQVIARTTYMVRSMWRHI